MCWKCRSQLVQRRIFQDHWIAYFIMFNGVNSSINELLSYRKLRNWFTQVGSGATSLRVHQESMSHRWRGGGPHEECLAETLWRLTSHCELEAKQESNNTNPRRRVKGQVACCGNVRGTQKEQESLLQNYFSFLLKRPSKPPPPKKEIKSQTKAKKSSVKWILTLVAMCFFLSIEAA